MRGGSLIAIEGLDGAGLTTQARRVVEELERRGQRALLTTEPSDGPVGQLARRLLAGEPALMPAAALRAFSLLFAARERGREGGTRARRVLQGLKRDERSVGVVSHADGPPPGHRLAIAVREVEIELQVPTPAL
jgi:hypothetical protein